MEHQLIEWVIRFLPYVLVILAGIVLAILLFSFQLWRYGPDIRKLNKFETIAQLAYFAEEQKKMTAAFGEATIASREMRESARTLAGELEPLRDVVIEVHQKLSEYHADEIVKERLEEQSGKGDGILWSARSASASASDPDALYSDMMLEWDKFLGVFRQRLIEANIAPTMNKIGKMIYMLTDRRRRSPLPVETAELITALHSQYKRYTRLQGTRAQWLTAEIRDEFVRMVETAIKELDRPIGPVEPQARTTYSDGAAPRTIQ